MNRSWGLVALAASLLALGCSSTSGSHADEGGAGTTLTGNAFGTTFVARDVLLAHPQSWKSAAAGSTAILVSDTPDLCAQIGSGKTTAPGRLIVVSLEEHAADGAITDLSVGSFVVDGQGSPSSRYGELFLSRVDAKCQFDKLFTDQSSIQVTQVGSNSAPVTVSVDVHLTSGESLAGSISATAGCDEAAVDRYLNTSPQCG